MLNLKSITKSMQKEKRRARNKNLIVAAALGATAGAVVALVLVPKADAINETIAEKKDDLLDLVDAGAKKAGELVHDGKEKAEKLWNDGKEKWDEARKEVKQDMNQKKEKLDDVKEDLKDGAEQLKVMVNNG